jgi:AcrR family transcriptional regulator
MQLAESAPRLTADQRVAEILALVRNAFAEKGFDGASMQDLARAAGMSVGNFYRYFPSKSAIVEQLIAHDLAVMEQDFFAVLSSDNPLQALRQQVSQRITQHQNCNDGQLWAEITANALRKPEIGHACQHMETAIAGYLTQVFAASTGLPLAEASARFSAHAAFIVMLVKSAAMMAPQNDQARHDLNILVLRSINQTLSEISAASVSAEHV